MAESLFRVCLARKNISRKEYRRRRDVDTPSLTQIFSPRRGVEDKSASFVYGTAHSRNEHICEPKKNGTKMRDTHLLDVMRWNDFARNHSEYRVFPHDEICQGDNCQIGQFRDNRTVMYNFLLLSLKYQLIHVSFKLYMFDVLSRSGFCFYIFEFME